MRVSFYACVVSLSLYRRTCCLLSPPPPGILCACFNSAVCLLLSLRSNSGPLGVAVDGIGRIWVSERHQQVQSSEKIALAVALTPLFLEDNIEAASREPRTRRGSVKVFDNDVLTEIPRQRIAHVQIDVTDRSRIYS